MLRKWSFLKNHGLRTPLFLFPPSPPISSPSCLSRYSNPWWSLGYSLPSWFLSLSLELSSVLSWNRGFRNVALELKILRNVKADTFLLPGTKSEYLGKIYQAVFLIVQQPVVLVWLLLLLIRSTTWLLWTEEWEICSRKWNVL